MPQEEVKRFAKENKALKTTVYVVGALLLCFSPMSFTFISRLLKKLQGFPVCRQGILTVAMLNSLFNPLIYCWRQKEMRKFIYLSRHKSCILLTDETDSSYD